MRADEALYAAKRGGRDLVSAGRRMSRAGRRLDAAASSHGQCPALEPQFREPRMIPAIHAHGVSIPAIGLGTYGLRGADAVRAIAAAIEAGYRHIDTAIDYGNEREIGEGIRQSGIDRDALFVTTKIPAADLEPAALIKAAEGSLERLGLDRLTCC